MPFTHKAFLVSALVGVLSLAAAGCSSQSETAGKPLPVMTFQHITPLDLNVESVFVESRYHHNPNSDDISASFPAAPDVLLRRYAESRLGPAGTSGSLKVIIEDASVRKRMIDPQNDFFRLLKMDRKEEYTIHAVLRLVKFDDLGIEEKGSILTVERTLTVPESLSLADLEHRQMEALEAMMDDVDGAVRKSLHQTFGLYSRIPEAR